tara:strand:+ start:185 stop:418 length:234 start_codon:yes stop_codon:yes gene_type:complete
MGARETVVRDILETVNKLQGWDGYRLKRGSDGQFYIEQSGQFYIEQASIEEAHEAAAMLLEGILQALEHRKQAKAGG